MENQNISHLFNRELLLQALKDSFIKLNPAVLVKNPVIFIVGIGALITYCYCSFEIFLSDIFQDLTFRLLSGSGLQFCLPILPKQLLKAVEKHRQIV